MWLTGTIGPFIHREGSRGGGRIALPEVDCRWDGGEMTDDPTDLIGTLEELSLGECLRFLSGSRIGRIAVVVDGFPLVFPVNYRFVDAPGAGPALVVRARPGGVVSGAGAQIGFQIDGIDASVGAGWSVLVRGQMRHVDADDLAEMPFIDPHPWAPGRDEWLVLTPLAISGRRLVAGDAGWGFHPLGYL